MNTFFPIPNPEQFTVNHKDGNKSYNFYTNLEWMTQSENNLHAKRTGLSNAYAENTYNAKMTNEQVHKICECLEIGMKYKEILTIIGMEITDNNKDLIGNIKRKITWNSISQYYNF